MAPVGRWFAAGSGAHGLLRLLERSRTLAAPAPYRPLPIRSRRFSSRPDPVVALQASKSSLTLGELACAVLLPVLAVVDAALLAASRCFEKSPPRLLPSLDAGGSLRAGGRLTCRELAELADESRYCKYTAACPGFCVLFRLLLWPEIFFPGCACWESR